MELYTRTESFSLVYPLIYWQIRSTSQEKTRLADDKVYSAVYAGSGTFIISKPKRKEHKRRQQKVKSPQRGARK